MTLRIRLILITTAVVTVLFGISEWLSFQHTTALLEKHEAILRETADHAVALERLKATRDSMFVSVTTMRLLHAAGTLLIAVAILNYVWYRVVFRPIQRLLAEINSMGRGTWRAAIPVKRKDEIGELTSAFNDLGEQLTMSFRYISASSKLAAMALLGSRIMRRVSSIRSQLDSSMKQVERGTDRSMRIGLEMLGGVDKQLESLETHFQKTFDEELAAAAKEPVKARAEAAMPLLS